jgi:Zn-dependent peptidase ImmA (M78 family)
MPTPKRFAEICLFAEDLRSQVARETSALDIGLSLEKLCSENSKLDYCVVERLPSYMDGAFACIIGELDGHTLFVEEKRFISAENGVLFARHVIGHELAHHYLHPDLLASDQRIFLPPQGLSKNLPELIDTNGQIEQVVDTIVEAEAELFATMFLVPWVAYLKGTSSYYLSKDYGEQPKEVERYVNFFKNPSVINALREALWNRGVRRHVIFGS